MHVVKDRTRPTIGLLTHGAGDPSNFTVWSGVADAAREHGVNLICFPGKPLRSIHGFEAQSNIIYDLVDPHTIDGLVIWLAGLTLRVEPEEIRTLCERYQPLPIVTAGSLLKGIPGVVVDNYHGMKDVVNHMIEVHGCMRIAFIRGPDQHQEAEERYSAYLDALAEHGLPFDPEIVVPGDFKESGGILAVDLLVERRHARFDALLAASDNMAVSAMRCLLERGLQIPSDLKVAGLNDEVPSKYTNPPLTTAPLHFYEQARQATMLVLALIRGEEVPEEIVLPTRLMVRQSCGCPNPVIAKTMGYSPAVSEDHFIEHSILLGNFKEEIQGKSSGKYLTALARELQRTASSGGNVAQWNEVISAFRKQSLPQFKDARMLSHAEDLLDQSRLMVVEYQQRRHAYQILQSEEKIRIIGEINQRLIITTSITELTNVLIQAIRLLNIPRFYLSLYEEAQSSAGWSSLILAYDEHGRVEMQPGECRFPSRQLIPDGFLHQDQQYSLVVEPLYFRDEQLGFILFEANPSEDEIYEILRGQVSGALKRAILTERNIRLYNEAVQARRSAEEADRLKSLFLSMVSHELRSPLSLIVGTIEMMLHEDQSSGTFSLPEVYRQDIDCIRTSARHLSRLIGDVLDLASSQAGELRLANEALNMSSVLKEAVLLGESLAREKGLAWRVDIPTHLPTVWGDRTRLRQVTLNLISNAVKFTEQGWVELKAEVHDHTITISVSDSGMGIPLEDQESIFDEFRRSERSLQRGYGGMGLGLAITRRLIELHGGEIKVRSSGEEEGGSTFYYSLPLMEGSPLEEIERANPSRTILLLAERAEHFHKLSDHLIQRGFEIEIQEIGNNPHWLAQLINNPPGAVVLDFQPATEQGWELMKMLKQNPYTQHIPVVFYSLFEERNSSAMLAMDYLVKPLGSTELAQALERMGLQTQEDGYKILIVDDDANILEMHARMILKQLPSSQVLKAKNGKEAYHVMNQTLPDLVLLDLMMPEMDGFELLQAMRAQKLTCTVPVIILTAQILTAQDMDRLHQGVAAVLGKGLFSAEEVLAQVESALARTKQLGSEAKRFVRQAVAYIHEHYAEPTSRSELANHLGVSENYLTRCFHQEMGITPVTYLNRFRIQQARTLLERGRASITEVALDVGFSDSNYFGRVFRSEVGITPLEYLRGSRPLDSR
jgi:signal transduction histidine kinase/DNA-binding LacI/PurR family transcriptional regulator/DNA-binding response OmpR family regulator